MGFTVQQEKFEGPLELLLDLIEKESLAISDVSLAQVADQYLAHLKSLVAIDREELAEFLVIAAHLMLIKSRTLLPNFAVPEEEEASIEALESRLKEYQRFRELAGGIRALEGRGVYILSREAYLFMEPIFYPPQKLDASILASIFKNFLTAIPKMATLAEEKIKRIVSLEEKISRIKEYIESAVERGFSEILGGSQEKVEIIVSFLALLELAKQKFLELRQDNLFADIVIKKIS